MNLTKDAIQFMKDWFEKNGGQNAVIGISGGKDSTVSAAICKEALGKEHVYGIMMPNGVQRDINDSKKVIEFLGINGYEININAAFINIISQIMDNFHIAEVSDQTKFNLPPRLRMSTLYAVAQTLVGGRVINTSNLCEAYVGWGTLFGDTVGDVAPLAGLTCSEIREIGHDLGLPACLVDKVPADGLTDKSDEDNLGFKYADVEAVIEGKDVPEEVAQKIAERHAMSAFKRNALNIPRFKKTAKI